MMIKIFHRSGCSSTRKAVAWLCKHNIKYEKTLVGNISESDYFKILSLTDTGLQDIVIGKGKNRKAIDEIFSSCTVVEAFEKLKSNPDTLKSPIIFDGNRLMVGYNEDEIRMFLPKDYRNLERSVS